MILDTETFWTLLHDKAHWEFEIFLMVLFDGVIGALLWPTVRKHWKHHIDRDKEEGWFAHVPNPRSRSVLLFIPRCLCAIALGFTDGIRNDLEKLNRWLD